MSGQTTTGGPEVVAMTSSTADTEDPTWSSGAVMVTGTTGSSISVSWSGAMDNVGVNAYQVYVDGSPDQVVSAPTTTATIIGLSASTSYTIRIEALDAAGNESTDGPDVTDSTDAGGGGQLITASNFSFSPDDVTVDNGTEVTFDNTGGTHSLIWESGSYPDESPASSGWTVVFTADAAGTFAYYCSVHGDAGGVGMSGTLTVDP